jgi:hypothetical protein
VYLSATGYGEELEMAPNTCPVWCDRPHTADVPGLTTHTSEVDQLAVASGVSMVVLLVWPERTGEQEQSEPPHVALVTTGSGADNMLQLTPEQAGQLADITHISGASPWLAKALAVAAVVLAPPVTT